MVVWEAKTNPLTLALVKLHLGVTVVTYDDQLEVFRSAALYWAESYTGLAFSAQFMSVYYEDWPTDGVFVLPYGQLKNLNKVVYLPPGASWKAGDGLEIDYRDFDNILLSTWNELPLFQGVYLTEALPELTTYGRYRIRLDCSYGVATLAELFDKRLIQAMLLKIKIFHMGINPFNFIQWCIKFFPKKIFK